MDSRERPGKLGQASPGGRSARCRQIHDSGRRRAGPFRRDAGDVQADGESLPSEAPKEQTPKHERDRYGETKVPTVLLQPEYQLF